MLLYLNLMKSVSIQINTLYCQVATFTLLFSLYTVCGPMTRFNEISVYADEGGLYQVYITGVQGDFA